MFNKSTIVVFIDRGRIQCFGGALINVVTLDIPLSIVRDLEVVNKDSLYIVIKQWIKQVNLQSAQLCIVLAESTYFEKTIATNDAALLETEALKFFDSMPFETITTKVFSLDKEKRAVAINRTYIEAICQAFELQGFSIRAIIPFFVLGPMAAKKVFDPQIGNYILMSIDALMKYNLVEAQEGASVSGELILDKSGQPKPKPNKNLPILLGAFGFLILILIILALTQM